MSEVADSPRCPRCGYLLIGRSREQRCPECGHQRIYRQRWIEGELHRDGPALVLPVFGRCLTAALVLLLPWMVRIGFSASFLEACHIAARPSVLWMDAVAGPCAMVACILLTRPIRTRGADMFGLNESSSLRFWIPILHLTWLVLSMLVVAAIFAVPGINPQPGQVEWQAMLLRAAAVASIPAQAAWILLMRHMASISDYLRDASMRKSTMAWTWIWCIFTLVILPMMAVKAFRGGNPDALAALVISFGNVGLGWGLIHSILLWWSTTNALTLAYEEVEREDQRAQRERERYSAPR